MKKLLIVSYIIFVSIVLYSVSEFISRSANINKQSYSNTKDHQAKDKNESDKYDEPAMFVKYFNEIRKKNGQDRHEYQPGYQIVEFQKALNSKFAIKGDRTLNKLNWIERGPANVGGRTRALWVDPADNTFSTWLAGSVGGGVWKTTDRGKTWENMTPDLPNLATTCLASSKSNPDIIYCGTGEGYQNSDAINGLGIFKSTDRGNSWHHIESSRGFQSINRIVVDHQNPDIVLCCFNNLFTSKGSSARMWNSNESKIMKSTDGGISWEEKHSSGSRRIQQIIAHPENFNILYASVNGLGILKSTDAGETWEESFNVNGESNRMEMAVSPVNPDKIFVSAESGNYSRLYMTTDAGEKWLQTITTSGRNYHWLGSQGWYDNTIAAHPYDENIVYSGGINLFKHLIKSGTDSVLQILDIGLEGESNWLTYFYDGLPFLNGSFGTGPDFWSDDKVVDPNNVSSIEIRFGKDKTQKAYRFTKADGSGKLDGYIYEDFVDVPFEVWDTDHKRKLAVSFVDSDKNGEYNARNNGREYIFVSTYNYSTNIRPELAQDMGTKNSNAYVFSPRLIKNADWTPSEFEDLTLSAKWGYFYSYRKEMAVVTDGYSQYGGPNNNSVIHVDHHNLLPVPTNIANKEFLLLNSNDGGVAYSTDEGNTWTETDEGFYNTSQFYGCDRHPDANEYIAGAQDNGTWVTPDGMEADKSTFYDYAIGGDGFEASWHYTDPNKIIGSSQFNAFRKTTDRGKTWNYAIDGLSDVSYNGGVFISRIAKSQADPDLVFAVGRSGVWRSENFANYWTASNIPDTAWNDGYYHSAQCEISIADPQVVWAGITMSGKHRILVSTNGGLDFNITENYDIATMGRLTGLDSDPSDPNTAYAVFSISKGPKILKTTDLGQSWTDITGFEDGDESLNGFPDVAVFSVLVMPYNKDVIWAGTEIGLFETTNGGQDWHYADNGLPAVSVWQMRIVKNQIILATHGRGVWSVDLPELNGYGPPDVTLAPIIEKTGQKPSGKIIIRSKLRSVYDSTVVVFNDLQLFSIGENIVGSKDIVFDDPSVYPDTTIFPVIHKLRLKSYKDGKEYLSGESLVDVNMLKDPVITYLDYFDGEHNFSGNGFEIKSIEKIENPAVHSEHPYPNNAYQKYLLLTPIIVADTNQTVDYNDIALVEPGDSLALFGTAGFYDYVVLEATVDGIEWLTLTDGYDSRFDASWQEAYNDDDLIGSDLYRSHRAMLTDNFNKRDTILIRMKLFADAYSNNWGWALDDLEIQKEGYVGVEDDVDYSKTISAYPNPASNEINIRYWQPGSGRSHISIIDINGRTIKQLDNGFVRAGYQNEKIDITELISGTYYIVLRNGTFTKKIKFNCVR